MNERIKELAIELAEQFDWDPPKDPTYYTFTAEDLERFAKIIITECCSATEGQPRTEIRNSILNHFGLTVPDLLYKKL